MNIFETAVRDKYRFPYKGQITVEDLWDLSPTQLNTVFKSLKALQKKADEDSLLASPTREDVELQTKINLVSYIFDVKQAEAEARRQKMEMDEKKRRLKELIATKQDAALAELPLDELKAMLASME